MNPPTPSVDVLFVLPSAERREALESIRTADDVWLVVRSGEEALTAARDTPAAVVVTGEDAGGMSGLTLIEAIASRSPATAAIWLLEPNGAHGERRADHLIAASLQRIDDGFMLREALRKGLAVHETRAGLQSRERQVYSCLLVEDHEPDAFLARRMLDRIGWSTTSARTLDEALELLAEHAFDVALTDLGLPDARGLDAVTMLARLAPDLAIVVLSGTEDPALQAEILREGAQDLLVKGDFGERVLQRTLVSAMDRRKNERRLHDLAHTDPLTNVANRRAFLENIDRAISASAGSGRFVALAMVDLDHFRSINDTYGHHVGDRVLKALAERLQESVRLGDDVGRLGGDEFGILIGHLKSGSEAVAIADRLREVVQHPIQVEELELTITASLGLVLAAEAGVDAERLVERADKAMYAVKKDGRNAVALWENEKTRMTADLGPDAVLAALERRELGFHYQGQFSQGRVTCIEALLRWEHPRLGVLAPGAFLPGIETTEVMTIIGRRSIDWALQDIARIRREGMPHVRLAFNMTPRQLSDPTLVDRIRNGLARQRLDGDALEIEITETVLMDQNQHLARNMAMLRSHGVRIAIDDFGAGYSSLSYLGQFPVDVLKLDGALIQGMDSRAGRIVVQSVIELGHRLGMEVVAEFVETEEQREELQKLGADRLQGYLLGRPMPADDWVMLVELEQAVAAVAG